MADDVEVVKIEAGPVKRFFIDILTRDIELNAAILDLVDNSVDSAHELRPDGDLSGLRVDIEASGSQFTITDNCAGITLDAARNYVFRLGRPEGIAGLGSSIGQFGVGMKRALFKIGSQFSVDSVTDDSHFEVDLDVAKWEKDATSWQIDMKIHQPGRDGFPSRGTTIIVDKLNPSIARALASMVEGNKLGEELRSKHRLAIERGLVISFNGSDLMKINTELSHAMDGDVMQPLVSRFTLSDEAGNDVEVALYVGVFAESVTSEDAQPEEVSEGEDKAGWYVFGNNRLLLAADKSAVTGWGGAGNLPLFHNQYSRFRGYVFMTAVDAIALPWNTTKTGVESADNVWVQVRGEMIEAGKPVIKMLNALKMERSAGNDVQSLPISAALGRSRRVGVSELGKTEEQPFKSPDPNPAVDTTANVKRITYTVPIDDFALVSEVVGSTTAAGVGRGTWDYFVEREVDLT